MRPVKLTMQAFGSYGKRTVIDFEKTNQNLFLITGDTGAGKSTVFDALVFALYGEASSLQNKKDGIELQSQFVDYDVEPFVELNFTEDSGENRKEYTVRRVPRHIRRMKRGSGTIGESESVSLLMPDGTEYPQRDADRKIEEIVGLTKHQFMQVAMIAQGEFMELLRARTEEKKVIFRKLFHTELYEKIVEELFRRRKCKKQEIDGIRTRCQTEISHVRIPGRELPGCMPEPEGVEMWQEDRRLIEELKAGKELLLREEKFSVAELERFSENLQILCEKLEAGKALAEAEYRKANREFLKIRDAYQRAMDLERRFEELDQAERDLAECADREQEVDENLRLITRITGAYEVMGVWERYQDAVQTVSDTERKLTGQQGALPELEHSFEDAAGREKEAAAKLDTEKQAFSELSARVKKALEILDRMEEVQREIEEKKRSASDFEKRAGKARQDLDAFEKKERDQRARAEQLGQAEILFEQWKVKCGRANEAGEEIAAAGKLQKETAGQKKKMEKARREYEKASGDYEEKNSEYENYRRIFLNTQAGLIAREQLREGKPCPVCGSLEHPHPCQLEEEHRHLTREMLDDMEENVNRLRLIQEQAAAKAQAASARLEEKEGQLAAECEKLRQKFSELIPGSGEEERFSLKVAEEQLYIWKSSLRKEGQELEQKVRKLEAIRAFLQTAESEKQKLSQACSRTEQSASEAKEALAASRAVWSQLGTSRDYQTREEAEQALREAETKKEQYEQAYQSARTAEQKAKSAKEKAETLIRRYQAELPGQREERDHRKIDYEAFMAEKDLAESEWKLLAGTYDRKTPQKLQNTVDTYNRKKAAAERLRDTARTAIGDQPRPVLQKLKAEGKTAEQTMDRARKVLEEVKEYETADRSVRDALVPAMEERRQRMEGYRRLNDLYSLLAGRVTGSRMDIETYVQRYYLERILHAANRRFQEMSAGQFILRMCDIGKAGEGKNRGLDLMVYSTVTGKEREIRTLSGGESFMAALSLALGMADQIQESAASVHLDMMFIDEGFGSLDDHSREKAVRVLQDMAEGSKMIGIISHVTELKQEIEDQLIVSKDEEGSHVRWQIS